MHGGTVAFPACIPYVRPEYCLTSGSMCRATERGHDIIARRSRGESSHDEGTLRSRFASEREAGIALHNPPEYDGPWWHAVGERYREISMYSAVRSSIFARHNVKTESEETL